MKKLFALLRDRVNVFQKVLDRLRAAPEAPQNQVSRGTPRLVEDERDAQEEKGVMALSACILVYIITLKKYLRITSDIRAQVYEKLSAIVSKIAIGL